MSLQDKLKEKRNMSEIIKEMKELKELIKSYSRVHMNEEMAKEVTIHNQLNQIQEKADKVMSNMQSILNTQGKMLEENAENLQAILINGHEEMEKSNNKTVKAVQEMQKSNVEELNQINNEISTSMTNIKRNLNETVKKAVEEKQKPKVEEKNQINNEISASMTNIKRNLNETVKKAEQETRDLVSNAKHGALVTNIIDALKYGAATSAITIPVLYFLLS